MINEEKPARISRVRHELRRRTLQVVRRDWLSPGMLRITLGGDDLLGFTSLGFDDHIKLFFEGAGEPAMRDFTPRRYDAATRELTIDFAMHEAGPATDWAQSAEVGATLNIGGPRGSFVVEDSFDWYVLAGDETALPAIGRRLEELRPGVPVFVYAEVDDADHHIPLASRADLTLHWVHRSNGESLADVARRGGLPKGEGYVWAAAEARVARALRGVFVDELGQPPGLIRVAAYWRQGAVGVHEVLESPARAESQ